jgi:hypothetical protein
VDKLNFASLYTPARMNPMIAELRSAPATLSKRNARSTSSANVVRERPSLGLGFGGRRRGAVVSRGE